MTTSKLFEPFRLGSITLPHRIVMAPMTRNRALAKGVPSPLMVEYYGQRSSGGLIISEATQISQQGQGFQDTPGIYTDEQIAGWRTVTDEVHAKGGYIFLQLWHVGRVSHVDYQPNGAAPVAPSAVTGNIKVYHNDGYVDASPPRALDLAEIPGIVNDYVRAAANAMKAGFDGVEIHGGNGFLLEQFARDGSNKRTDAYGGSVEKRARLMLEVAGAVAKEIGAERTGLQFSPVSLVMDCSESDPQSLYFYLAEGLSALNLVYLNVYEGSPNAQRDTPPFDYAGLRKRFKGAYIGNNAYDLALAEQAIASGAVDLVSFGKPFIVNPDLVMRFRTGAPLNPLDRTMFYGRGAEGYTDYPTLEQSRAR